MNDSPSRHAIALALLLLGCDSASSSLRPPPTASSIASTTVASSASAVPPAAFPPLLAQNDVGKPPTNLLQCNPAQPPPSEAVLRQRADADDSCALASLGESVLGRARTAAEFREAADLLRRAHDRNVRIGACYVFDLGIGMEPDPRRAAVCQWRNEAWVDLAAAQALGQGVPRDLPLARRLLEEAKRKHPDPDCTHDQVQELIDKGNVAPSGSPSCDHAACTTLDLNQCMSMKLTQEKWMAAARREELVSKLNPASRAKLDGLLEAMNAFATEESLCVYWEYADGSIRNVVALGRESLVRGSFDTVLAKAVGRSLPPATEVDVTGLRKSLGRELETQRSRDFINAQNAAPFGAACDKAHRAFGKYEDAWVAFGETVVGNEASSARAMRAIVLRERIRILRDHPVE